MNYKSKVLQYAGHRWSIQKHARFGANKLVYYLIFGECYIDGKFHYITYLKDIDRNKLLEVLICDSFLNSSERYFNLLSCYA